MSKKKLITLITTILMLVNSFAINAASNFEISVSFSSGYDSSQGHLEYQLDDGSWVEVSDTYNTTITEDFSTLKVKVVANQFYEVVFDPDSAPNIQYGGSNVFFGAGGMDEARAALTSSGYPIDISTMVGNVVITSIGFRETTSEINGDVSISIEGEGIEYWVDRIPSRINFKLPGNTEDIEMGVNNLKWKDDLLPPNATGVSTINPVSVAYDYDNSGFVKLSYSISNASTKITSLIVNDVDYTIQTPQTDEEIYANIDDGSRSTKPVEITIPYSSEYVIKVVASEHDLMGGFGWNYLPEETLDGDSRKECIPHGTLTFVSGEYNNVTYSSVQEWNNATIYGAHLFSWTDGDKYYSDPKDAWGSAAFPKNAKITMKLIPDKGYQLVSLYGDKDLVREDEVGVYTITMTGGMNSHLSAEFVAVDDVLNVYSSAVKVGEFQNLENPTKEGTMKLSVTDANLDGEKQTAFDEKAQEEEVEIKQILDISLANTIYKATSNPELAWDTPVTELTSDTKIKLELVEDLSKEEEIILIHNHNDAFEIIPVDYDENDNSITFTTKKFSDYAIATRSPSQFNITVTPDANGTVESYPDVMDAGEKNILINVNPKEGYVFDHVEASGINKGDDGTTYSLLYSGWPTVGIMINEMPANDISFDVFFTAATKIVFDANGGNKGPLWEDERLIKKNEIVNAPFKFDDDILTPPDNKELDYVEVDGVQVDIDADYTFDTDVVGVKYIWKDKDDDEYHVFSDDGKAEMIFIAEKNHTFSLKVFDLLNLSDEDYITLEIDKATADQVIEGLKQDLSDYKDILAIYLPILESNDGYYPPGPERLRIKVDNKFNNFENLRTLDITEIIDGTVTDPASVESTNIENGYLIIDLNDFNIISAISGTKKPDHHRLPVTGIH